MLVFSESACGPSKLGTIHLFAVPELNRIKLDVLLTLHVAREARADAPDLLRKLADLLELADAADKAKA